MISQKDRERLRAMAAEYAEMVTGDEMNERREIWRRTNRLEERTVPFQIEDNGTFFSDLMPPLECEGEYERHVEGELLRALTNYRLIDDDRVYPRYCCVNWIVHRPSICPELEIERAAGPGGRKLGYKTNKPLADLEKGLEKLQRGKFVVDRKETQRRLELMESTLGDLLPVKLTCRSTYSSGTGMAGKAVTMMGMDNFYMAMIDEPENVHRFFDFVATECSEFLNFLEAEQLIEPNHEEFCVGSGSCGYTDELPRRTINGGEKLLPSDCWGFIEAQEAAGISPEMYTEFIFPYQQRLAERYGLVYYGCCEPVHQLWPTIKQFTNLRKITVSPWCDQQVIAEGVGKNVVLSRKPHPLKLCDETFESDVFEAHIRETLDIAKDNFVELIFRDTCTLKGSMKDRLDEACRIIRRLIGRERSVPTQKVAATAV